MNLKEMSIEELQKLQEEIASAICSRRMENALLWQKKFEKLFKECPIDIVFRNEDYKKVVLSKLYYDKIYNVFEIEQ